MRLQPPDAVFRAIDEVPACPDCPLIPDVWAETHADGGWFLEVVHQCGRPTELIDVA